ncbi:ATP-sensitive inward rectifier potassium channel 10 [Phormidium sp. CLA17]|uniref:ion channel n=1 Tax=Leptolyngbya sp. Cla-17 TaxID=2803751 RepID=UPI0014931EFB|nr:ion channel [Leptolyngbya sp. Cla-17]MBM0741972.1 ATP-sensitive inward rectifier potassium channel 10 [Leptolyngbya sp. Cla-17]
MTKIDPPSSSQPHQSPVTFQPKSLLNLKSRRRRSYKTLTAPNGRTTFLQVNFKPAFWGDLYHLLLTMSWIQFLGLAVGLYLLSNLLFAVAYLLGDESIANAKPGSLLDAFFFSVQTMATIGYGAMYPKTLYANFLVAIEALIGLLGVAMITGLMFARFSRPTARVMFSRVAVVVPYNGRPTLMFRTANKRGNQILEARLWATLVRSETTSEGYTMRRIYDLNLIRSHSPLFTLSWTAMHPIDENSPLYGETPESLANSDADIIVSLTGLDETVAQPIHARESYAMQDLIWNHRFVDVIFSLPNGQRIVDYSYFHDVMAIDAE